MTFEEFTALVQKIEQSVRDPKYIDEVLNIISKLSVDEMNAQYKRAKKEDSHYLPKERILEVALKAYFNATGFSTKPGDKLPETCLFDIIKALIEKKASLILLDGEGNPSLHQAIFYYPDKNYITRYHAALNEFFSLVAKNENADFNVKNQLGDNLLIRAVKTRNYLLVEWLHSQFACDLNLPNKGTDGKFGLTVLDILNDVPSSSTVIDDIKAYVEFNKGVSGKALASGAFEELGRRMGRENYNRLAAERRSLPKSEAELRAEAARVFNVKHVQRKFNFSPSINAGSNNTGSNNAGASVGLNQSFSNLTMPMNAQNMQNTWQPIAGSHNGDTKSSGEQQHTSFADTLNLVRASYNARNNLSNNVTSDSSQPILSASSIPNWPSASSNTLNAPGGLNFNFSAVNPLESSPGIEKESVLFSSQPSANVAKNTEKPAAKPTKPRLFISIQGNVKLACQFKKETMFQENVTGLTKEQWLLLLKKAEEWKTSKTPSIQAFFITFIDYCANLAEEEQLKFPEEITNLVKNKRAGQTPMAVAAPNRVNNEF